ncbi:PREDICTED: uncharacterized protein LOC109351998 isoform X2 [Lupinus angustifolius]|uniref:uncharacterized protein LOC109351998 isoform X2 n=1 Tax=Lupinus angustifolius TaxID=3871 RepID=UPI00092FD409|nr:PREDICTED: uncharacterized protein LOC109351998 isoform X2 [Lupinus angustifolius]
MLVYLSSLQLNWLLELFGLAEKKATISDDSSNINHPCLIFLFILLIILIGIGLYFNHLAENTEYNNNSSEDEVDQSLKEDHYFDGGQQLRHRNATRRGFVRRYGACALCGNLSSKRCSRCKVARYCSVECQISHWRSGHKHECFERETTADQARPIHAKKSEGESTSNGVKLASDIGEVDVSNGSDFNNLHCSCEVCGSPSTTKCTRCKTVTYCSTKCLIEDWRWHKVNCTAGEVNSTPTERFHGDVEVLKNSREEEENVHSSEGTTNSKSPIKGSKKDPTKEAQEHGTAKMGQSEDEATKYRNRILLLQSERDHWIKRANFARERFHSLKKESEHRLFVLKSEKESISNAEKKASNMVHNLHERLHNMQIAVQKCMSEKRKLEEHLQMVESDWAKANNELQKEKKHVQCLTVECDKSCENAQIAKIAAEVVRQELQEERERVQRLKENVRIAQSRASFAEAKLSDLHKKIKSKDYKACAICLTNEKDLAFGCGHMTCRDCGSKLSKCPICREHITSHIKLFPG